MKKIVIILILFLISCSNLKEGEIYKKEFTPKHTQMILMPIIISTGKTTMTSLVPMWFYFPDSYSVGIKKYNEEKKEYETRTIYIDKNVYELVNIGNWYKVCDYDCDEPVKIKMEK